MFLFICMFLLFSSSCIQCLELHLTTSDEGYVTVIQGFAARLECTLSTCVRHAATVVWFKDDIPLFNATNFLASSGVDPNTVLLQHRVEYDREKDCASSCSDSKLCEDGSHCLDNRCCPCTSEEFTLVLKNLTFDDAGRYRCQISNQPEHLEFQLEVLESGLKGGFHENISYDYSECCEKKGISPLCKAMCKPKDMHIHYFDPTSCKTDDYKNFLSCATEGGNRSHVQCCKTQLVPSFCYDFCSGNFQMLRKSHRLCLYYLPEIFECYNRAYLPYPDHPLDLIVNAIGSDELKVCWQPPQPQSSNQHLGIDHYTVYYKQIPSFPFLGGDDGMPLLSGDYEEPNVGTDEEFADSTTLAPISVKLRRKRQTWLFVTHDSTTNDSTVREFKFEEVNTTETCLTLKDLRSATRYIVYVTASNKFGMSVPSTRALATTNAIASSSNTSLPEIEHCCTKNGASPYCVSKMCNIKSMPNALETIAISTSCRSEWSKVSPCLADGRNHTDCCIRKGVQHDCLKICGGLPEALSVHSLLCLNLDIPAIYQCLRQGYETRPSPPVNVTVNVFDDSVEIEWQEPESNAHLVESFSLFLVKNSRGAEIIEIHNVTSPHTEYGLDPDSEYTVYLQSHSSAGDSLYSTSQIFFTNPYDSAICKTGKPLYDPNGHKYNCVPGIRECPISYECIVAKNSDVDTYCCPKSVNEESTVEECCRSRGISQNCLKHCYYNSSLTEECSEFSDFWVQCASDGHDHSKCCIEFDLPSDCMDACRHPFVLKKECISHAPLLSKCYFARYLSIPKVVSNLEVVSRNISSVLLSWDLSSDASVQQYEVQLFKQGSLYKKANTSTNSYQFDNLESGTNYTAHIISYSKSASSPPSLSIAFQTLTDNEMGDKPMPPTKLRVAWNYGKRINITWDWDPRRNNGELINQKPIFYIYYVPANILVPTTPVSSWTTVTTNDKWYVMEDLFLDKLYEVYVVASDGRVTSRSSSVITILAAPDELSLPEPVIIIDPNYTNRTYFIGQQIGLKCSVNSRNALNLDLIVGTKMYHNNPPSMTIETSITIDEKVNGITCIVMDTDGRQNRAYAHIFVQFGPEVTMPVQQINAYDDLSAEIHCTIKAYPEPNVIWTYRQSQNSLSMQTINGPVFMKKLSNNEYDFVLFIKNVTGRNGFYSCRSKGFGDVIVSKEAELVVSKADLPLSPRFVLQCCVDAQISDNCLKACSVNPEFIDDDCSVHSNALIECAKDGRDHRRCCMDFNIPSECLGLCSSNSKIDLPHCSMFAAKAVACMIRGHESAPPAPGPIHYENLSHRSIKIHWNEAEPGSYKVYAVYYRPENSDDDFIVKKTTDNEMIIDDLEPNTNYDLALVSANALGHSPFVETKILNAPSEYSRSRSSLVLPLCFILIVLLIAIVGILYTSRIITLPQMFRRWQRSPLTDRDPSVAFENPGYGTEVQIRGLSSHSAGGGGGAGEIDWQNAELEIANNAISRESTNNGMRYAKLNSS